MFNFLRRIKGEKDTYKYQLKVGGKIVYRGVANDLDRQEQAHQATWPGSYIKQIGRKTTRKDAHKWEREGGRRRYRG